MQKLTLLCAIFFLMSCSSLTEPTNSNNNGIEGIWQVYKPNPSNTSLDFEEMVFFKNGISSEWVPAKGLYNYDPNSEPDHNSNRYTFDGTSGQNKSGPQLQFADELVLQSANELKIGYISNLYRRCASVDGKKLNASYTSYGDITSPTLATLPYGQKPVITFANDGSFYDEGLFSAPYFSEAQPGPGQGTYELKDFSIIMSYTDGRTKQFSLHGTFSTDVSTSDKIWFGGLDLNKM